MEKILGIPWYAWLIMAACMVATVFCTEVWKKIPGVKRIPGLILFWLTGILFFAGMTWAKWMTFDKVPVIVFLVVGGGLNAAYYKDILHLKSSIRKLLAGEVPIVDVNNEN